MDLFDTSKFFKDDLFRNIVKQVDISAFDDLSNGNETLNILADSLELNFESKLTDLQSKLDKDFLYSAAINYSFEHEPFMHSRFSDGSFPIWYGSLEMKTCIYETAYHTFIHESSIVGLDEIVKRDRQVYLVNCTAILIDLTKKSDDYPKLLDNDYSFCQHIGQSISDQGVPGLLSNSARFEGINAAILNRDSLKNPRFSFDLVYFYNPSNGLLSVSGNGFKLDISF